MKKAGPKPKIAEFQEESEGDKEIDDEEEEEDNKQDGYEKR